MHSVCVYIYIYKGLYVVCQTWLMEGCMQKAWVSMLTFLSPESAMGYCRVGFLVGVHRVKMSHWKSRLQGEENWRIIKEFPCGRKFTSKQLMTNTTLPKPSLMFSLGENPRGCMSGGWDVPNMMLSVVCAGTPALRFSYLAPQLFFLPFYFHYK